MKLTIVVSSLLAGLAAAQTLTIPTRVGSKITLSAPSIISGVKDLGNKEYDLGQNCALDVEYSAKAVFILEAGAILSNVIIGAGQKSGVHCKGACTLKNVWFRDVCEEAIFLLGNGNVSIEGGGAQNAEDKVVNHSGLGTVTIKDYTVVNVAKLYRSCGNCAKNGGPRNVIITNLRANTVKSDLVGINSNFGDVAMISGSCGTAVKEICQEYKGVAQTAQSTKVTSTANCRGVQANLAALPACK